MPLEPVAQMNDREHDRYSRSVESILDHLKMVFKPPVEVIKFSIP